VLTIPREELGQQSLALHQRYRGKLEIRSKVPLRTKRDLARAYTPGVAEVCRAIAKDPDLAYRYTLKGNTIAVVTDGSAVLGLGNIGGHAAIPVMEGKAALFREFAGIDAFPLCFEGYSTDFVDQVKNIAPVFGGINLEDIAAPKCFEVEESDYPEKLETRSYPARQKPGSSDRKQQQGSRKETRNNCRARSRRSNKELVA